MTIRIPESLRDALRDAEINVSIELPNPKIATKADKDGSLSLEASYDIGEIYKTASNVANAIYEVVDNAVIDELLELNGYTPERTCRIKKHRCTNCDHEINDRAYFAKVVLDDGCWTAESRTANYCPCCGAKLVQE